MDNTNEEDEVDIEDQSPDQSAESQTAKLPVLTVIYRVLIGFALVLALFLIVGSIVAVVSKSRQAAGGDLQGTETTISGDFPNNVFTGIGRQRLSTADSVTVIFFVSFPYPVEDKSFTEELVSRIGDFRTANAEYFMRMQAEDLNNIDESVIKAALLGRYNSILRLGKIEILYFNDFFILE